MESPDLWGKYMIGNIGEWGCIQGYRSADYQLNSMRGENNASEIKCDTTNFCLFLRKTSYDQLRSYVFKLVRRTIELIFGFSLIRDLIFFSLP